MNRRDFIRRGAVGAASAAIIAAPVAAEVVVDDFPETEEAMRKVMKEKGPARHRPEGSLLQEGLNATTTSMATYWYYKRDNRVAVLREADGHVRFEVHRYNLAKPKYFPPLNNGNSILQEQRENNWPAWPSKRDKAL